MSAPRTPDGLVRERAVILGVELHRTVWETVTDGRAEALTERTLRLRVEPRGGSAYEAEVVLEPGEAVVTANVGARVTVLVDPNDPRRVLLAPPAKGPRR